MNMTNSYFESLYTIKSGLSEFSLWNLYRETPNYFDLYSDLALTDIWSFLHPIQMKLCVGSEILPDGSAA